MVECPIPEQYPELFKCLGTFSQQYTIQLSERTTPHAIYSPRNITLRDRVGEKN